MLLGCGVGHWHSYALERPQKQSLDTVSCGLRQEHLISVVMITYLAWQGLVVVTSKIMLQAFHLGPQSRCTGAPVACFKLDEKSVQYVPHHCVCHPRCCCMSACRSIFSTEEERFALECLGTKEKCENY